MKKIFQSKSSIKTTNKKEIKTVQHKNTTPSHSLIYYDDQKAFEILEIWNDITNWNIKDFQKILELANISLPITISTSDPSTSKFYCIDKDNVPFTITFKFLCTFSFSKLFIEFENESFLYNLNNKSHNKNEIPKLILVEHIIRSSNEIYSFTFDNTQNMITQALFVNNSELVYVVEYILLDVKRKCILEKIFKSKGLCKTFDNLKNSTVLLKNIINNLNLTSNELNALEIKITFKYCNVIFSKISLSKNVIVELNFTTDEGHYNLSNFGKLIFTSNDKNLSFVINDISKCFNKNSICIENFNAILDYANTMFEKMKYNDFIKN